MTDQRRTRLTISADSKAVLAAHARLRHDPAQGRWVLLVPEKVLHPSETAVEVLQHCDGARSVRDVAAALASLYAAPVDTILADIVPLLQDLADKGYVTA